MTWDAQGRARLLLQPLFIRAPLWVSGGVDWPFRPSR